MLGGKIPAAVRSSAVALAASDDKRARNTTGCRRINMFGII
jgi:hypothetical protein